MEYVGSSIIGLLCIYFIYLVVGMVNDGDISLFGYESSDYEY